MFKAMKQLKWFLKKCPRISADWDCLGYGECDHDRH